MALAKSYISFCIAHVIAGLTSSFSQTVPPSTVADIFVKEVRGTKMSMFGVAVVIAPAIAPIFCGLVVNSLSWRILYWIILGLAGLQLILFFFVVPETLWVEDQTGTDAGSFNEDVKSGEEQRIETAAAVVKKGHCGSAWMPWQRPGEYTRLFMSPIIMVNQGCLLSSTTIR
jgi:MFS family permease